MTDGIVYRTLQLTLQMIRLSYSIVDRWYRLSHSIDNRQSGVSYSTADRWYRLSWSIDDGWYRL